MAEYAPFSLIATGYRVFLVSKRIKTSKFKSGTTFYSILDVLKISKYVRVAK